MGEEEKPKGGEKEKEKEKEKKGDGGAENKKKDKKDESPPVVVLRTDLHCEGCATKVKRAIKSLPGVDAVSADTGSNMVTVTGPADAWAVKERIEAKTKRRVEFVSPANPPKKDKDKDKDKVAGDKKPVTDSPKPPKKDAEGNDKKPKEPPESTVMLKIRLHCEGCIDRIRRRIYKVKGVREVTVDAAKDLVTVKGTMDVSTLPSLLRDKFRRSVEIVPAAKKDGGGGDSKDKEKEKKGGGDGGGGDKKEKKQEEKKPEKGGGGEEKGAAAPPPAADAPPPAASAAAAAAAAAAENRYDYYYPPYGYRVEMGHAPQMFSDENPNACAVM